MIGVGGRGNPDTHGHRKTTREERGLLGCVCPVSVTGTPIFALFSPKSAPFCSKMAPRLLQFWSVGVRSHLNFCFFAIVCSETLIFTMVTSRESQSRRLFEKSLIYTLLEHLVRFLAKWGPPWPVALVGNDGNSLDSIRIH